MGNGRCGYWRIGSWNSVTSTACRTRPCGGFQKNQLKPWKRVGWVILPQGNGHFVAAMEHVLDVYRRPYDPAYPVVCMDETPRQLIGETRAPVPARPGQPERHDYEYRRCGVCNVFMATEPLAGQRMTQVTEHKTKIDWARFVGDVSLLNCPGRIAPAAQVALRRCDGNSAD